MKTITISKLEENKYRVEVKDRRTRTEFGTTYRTLRGVLLYLKAEVAADDTIGKDINKIEVIVK